MRIERLLAATLLWIAAAAGAAEPETLVIIGTRVQQPAADLPMSIDRLDRSAITDGQLQVNLSEALQAVPGVSAQNRQNYAQDLQLSVRGFGARSSFGVRGVRLYADGIPATMPDGQGQFSHFDLGSADHIEVLRGPFSALYGNSSGGVLAIFTEDAPAKPQLCAVLERGSEGLQRYALKGSTRGEYYGLLASVAHFRTDGYRVHSAAERTTFNARLRWQPDADSSLTLIANGLDMPESQDPLGLTRAQLTADRQQAGSNALAYDTRKSLRQAQLGVSYQRTLSVADELQWMVYNGHRSTTQFQSIPRAVQTPATHPGGVIDLGRAYWGSDLHVSDRRTLAGRPLLTTVGLSLDRLHERRKGYLNFRGAQLGVQGALRRAERNAVSDLDEYAQLQWDPGRRWRAMAGVRHSVGDINSDNELLSPGAARSQVRYSAVNPVAGLTFRADAHLNLYGAYGRGFETPTLNDLAYRSTDGSLPGLNLGLRPARSDNYELGLKFARPGLRATLAAFRIDTRDELAVQSSAGGRTVFTNLLATQRKGAELGAEMDWSPALTARLAYTHLDAETSTGHRLPAVAADTLYTALSWRRPEPDLALTVEVLGRAKIYVDDRNSDAAAGYAVANLHCELGQRRGGWRFSEMLRLDNLTDRSYVGSVIVNESNGRYFEPEPGRSVYLGLSVARDP